MGLYGTLDNDGRVLRSIDALKNDFELIVYSYVNDKSFNINNVSIKKRGLRYYQNNPLLDHFLYLIHFIKIAFKVRPEIIYVHDYYLALTGVITGLLTGAKVVYDSHELMIIKNNSKVGFRHRFFSYLEKLSIKRFNLIISANDERAIIMKRCYKLTDSPLTINNIPNFDVLENLITLDEIQFRYKFRISDYKNIFVYQGVITPIREIDIVVSQIALIPDSLILLIGKGKESYVAMLKQKLNFFSNIRFLGQVDLISLYSILRIADYGIISYSNKNLNNKYCAPNKLYEYANFNLPIITSDQRIFKRLFKKYKIGLYTYANNQTFLSDFENFSHLNSFTKEIEKFKATNKWKFEADKLVQYVKGLY